MGASESVILYQKDIEELFPAGEIDLSFACEVVREALRLMAQQDTHRNAKLDQLLKDIHAGIDCGIVTAWDVEEIKRAVRKRRETKKAD